MHYFNCGCRQRGSGGIVSDLKFITGYSNDPSPIIFFSVLALLLMPMVVELSSQGSEALFGYFENDAFTYLAIARNFHRFGFFTFDGQYPTNGFHPLWMALIAFVTRFVPGQGAASVPAMAAVFALQTVSMAGGVSLIMMAMRKAFGRLPEATILMPVGITGLCCGLISYINPYHDFGRYGSLWSLINGLESSAVILVFGAIAYFFIVAYREDLRFYIGFGVLLGILALARLDHVFFAGAVILWLAVEAYFKRDATILRGAAIVGVVVALIVGTYLGYNWVTVNALLPVSGAVKSSFPIPNPPPFGLVIKSVFAPDQKADGWLAYRAVLVLVPAIMVVPTTAVLAYRWWRHRVFSGWDRFLGTSSLFVLLLGAYNWLFVAPMNQGGWYFPISVVYATLSLVTILNYGNITFGRYGLPSFAAIAAVYYLLACNTHPGKPLFQQFVMSEAERVRGYFDGAVPLLVEADDGIINFGLGSPTLSASGLMLDVEGVRERSRHRLLHLAEKRGYSHLASLIYTDQQALDHLSAGGTLPGDRIKMPSAMLDPVEARDFEFALAYKSPESAFAILSFRRISLVQQERW